MAINHGSLSANLTPRGVVGGRVQNSVLAYENDYENLINKPSINDTELNGDLSLEDLGIVNNVQPDWEQTDTEAGDYINNKPDIPENLSDLNDDADHRTVSDTEKTTWNNKSDFSGSYNDLTDKPVIPDAQIQSDWNQNDNTKADYIKNKPSIPSAQVQSDWNESDSSKADFIKNKPTIPAEQVNSDWDAESGKAQILNKPSIPTALADLTDDSTHRTVTDTEKTAWNSGEANVQSNWNETDTTSDAYIQNKPSIPSVTANPGSTTATLSSIGIDGTNYAVSGGSGGGAVNSVNGKTGDVILGASDVGALPDDTPLFSGDYEDLANKPTIPDDLADLNDDSTHRLVTDTEKTTWNGKSDFSGSYNDLSNKPTLGTASALDVPVSGNASTSQVVKGDDSRLTDARTPVSHTHTTSDITDFPTMSDYIQKSNTSGLVKNDGTIDTNSYATTSQIPDISGKADKVSGATNGNLAGLDANGNLTDAGWASDKTTTSATGNPISISGLKSNQLAINPIITLEPIQAGSGTPSPSNIRAISGYDKVEVLSCGKNLLKYNEDLKAVITTGGVTYTINADKTIVANGTTIDGGSYLFIYGYGESLGSLNSIEEGDILTGCPSGGGVNTYELICGSLSDYYGSDYGEGAVLSNFTTNGIRFVIHIAPNTTVNNIVFSPMVRKPNTSATYEPYTGSEIQLTLGQTIYGGTLDVEKGILTVDRGIVDLGTLSWTRVTDNVFNSDLVTDIINVDGSIIADLTCEIYFKTYYISLPTGGIATQNRRLWVRDNTVNDDLTVFITQVNGKMLVYPLAQPYTIQLTPHEISLLKDYTYVSTNGTNMSFSYKNGEMASLGDVESLGKTMNLLGDSLDKNCDTLLAVVTNNSDPANFVTYTLNCTSLANYRLLIVAAGWYSENYPSAYTVLPNINGKFGIGWTTIYLNNNPSSSYIKIINLNNTSRSIDVSSSNAHCTVSVYGIK